MTKLKEIDLCLFKVAQAHKTAISKYKNEKRLKMIEVDSRKRELAKSEREEVQAIIRQIENLRYVKQVTNQ